MGAVLAALIAMALVMPPATAQPPTDRAIVLPGATGTEGVARLNGSTFFAGDLLTGDIFRGRINQGTAAKFIDAPDGRFAAGMKADSSDELLFVAGGPTGQGYVYDTRTGAPVSVVPVPDSPDPDLHQRRRTLQGRCLVHRLRPGAALLRPGGRRGAVQQLHDPDAEWPRR